MLNIGFLETGGHTTQYAILKHIFLETQILEIQFSNNLNFRKNCSRVTQNLGNTVLARLKLLIYLARMALKLENTFIKIIFKCPIIITWHL